MLKVASDSYNKKLELEEENKKMKKKLEVY